MTVSERFSNGDTAKTVLTVGDLIEELQRLPSETPLRSDVAEGVDVVIFNAPTRNSHVRFEPAGVWDYEEDEDDEEDEDEGDCDTTCRQKKLHKSPVSGALIKPLAT